MPSGPTSIRPLAALVLAVALPLSGLAVTPAAAAEPAAIPQAPVLSVIARTETLPFTLPGGGTIEIAVLTAGQTLGDATWQPADELAMEPYYGQTIRVLARAQGVTDPADYFDATYAVRDTYPPAWDLGNAANPTGAIAASNTAFKGWATGWENLRRGPNVTGGWLERSPGDFLGQVPAASGSASGATTHLVVLGDNGEITATFRSPITDGPGNDFAVFENTFRISGGQYDFAELGYIEVSSNGTDFVRFDSATLSDLRVGAFGGMLASNVGGVAGQYWSGYGAQFDLSTLKNRPEVRSGRVDLSRITHVKVRDIAGCGDELDSFGRPIYDPCGTAQSGGFDLQGIGVLNQADNIPWIDTPVLTAGPQTASLATKVTANGTAQTVWAELAPAATPDQVRKSAEVAVTATQRNRNVASNFTGLTRGDSYQYRVVARSATGAVTATDWIRFTAPDVLFTSAQAELSYQRIGTDGTVDLPFYYVLNPVNGNDLSVVVEYSENPDGTDSQFSEAKKFDGRFTWNVQVYQYLYGLKLDWDYVARVVATSSTGIVTRTDWKPFHTRPTSDYPRYEPRLSDVDFGYSDGVGRGCTYVSSAIGNGPMSVQLMAEANSGGAITYGDIVPVEQVGHGGYGCATISGIDIATHSVILRVFDQTGPLSSGASASGNNRSKNATATAADPPASDVTATTATLTAAVELGKDGGQQVSIEYGPAGSDRTQVAGDAWIAPMVNVYTWSDGFRLGSLAPATEYRARTVLASLHFGGRLTYSAWTTFTTEPLPAALGDPATVSDVTRTSALATVEVNPSGYARTLTAEVEPVGGGDPIASQPVTVDADAPAGPVGLAVAGLTPHTAYRLRVVSSVPGAADETTQWTTFTTGLQPAELGRASVSAISASSATVDAVVTPGDLAQQVRVEFTPGDRTDASATRAIEVPSGLQPVTVPIALTGLAPNTDFSYRVVLAGPDGTELTSDWATFTTAKVADPAVSVSVSPASARVGDTVTVTWDTTDAAGVTATGSWQGGKAASGSEQVTIASAGDWTFGITATGEAGNTTTVTAVVTATLPAANLTVVAGKALTAPGGQLTVETTGLAAGEPYTIAISGIPVATGNASGAGAATASVTVPKALSSGDHPVTVTGSTSDRTGQATAKLVPATKKLTIKATAKVKRGKKVTVTTTGLAPHEPVTIKVGTTTVAATASSKGKVSVKVTVPKKAKKGKTKVTITGVAPGRTGSKTIKVK